uniref:Amidase domain-containing protein n=1 Tax=Haptolina brevifila TaxID=156173 RepID=A0A7S2IBM9_9EUKA|mmetsp:Transcript_63897/g.126322  ORF Transcript_63897/g.126322 Transcript_63897/m.126322 type:complete len:294 (+) Transcript_63897:305-1186(+)
MGLNPVLASRPYLERHVAAAAFTGNAFTAHAPSASSVLRATAGVEARLLRVEHALSTAGVPIVAAEWQCGEEAIEVTAGDGAPALYTSLGQMSTYVHDELAAEVSSVSIVRDIQRMGASHNPKNCFERAIMRSGAHRESAYRRFMASRPDVLRCYNSIFEEHRLDLLLLPAQLSDAVSYVDAANASVPTRDNATNATVHTTIAGVGTWHYWKTIPVPKLLVPTGLDENGRPTGVMLFGKGPSPAMMFNDTYATTFDLPFLYAAKAVVEALYAADPGLRRAHAPLVRDLFETVD